MTKAVFYTRNGGLTGFSVTGHTDDTGSEQARIVCAAVSSAVYMAANTVTDVIGDKADISVSDGCMRLMLQDSKADSGRSRDILRGLLVHLRGLEEQYPQFIKINTEVQHDA